MPDLAVLVNASCDLPPALIERLGIISVPNKVTLGGRSLQDDRDVERTLAFYDFEFDTGKEQAEIEQPGAEGYLAAVQQYAVLRCDELLVLTPLRDLAAMYEQVSQGTAAVATASLEQRMAAGRRDVFRLHIEDSRSLFAPNGLLAWEAAEMIAAGEPMSAVRQRIQQLAPQAYGYYLPFNLRYIANRARDSRDKPNAFALALGSFLDVKPIACRQGSESQTVAKVRGMPAAAEKLFGRVAELVRKRQLLVPRLLVSYGGNPKALGAMPGFAALEQTCQEMGVQLATSVMSMSTGLFLGRQAIAVGLVAQPHTF